MIMEDFWPLTVGKPQENSVETFLKNIVTLRLLVTKQRKPSVKTHQACAAKR